MFLYKLYMVLDVIVVFLLCFYAFFLVATRKTQALSHLYLAAFLFSTAMSYMDGVFIHLNVQVHAGYYHMVHATMSFDFLMGPFLLLYILSRTDPNFSFRPKYWAHFAIFPLHLLYLISALWPSSGLNAINHSATSSVFGKTALLVLTSLSTLHLLLYFAFIGVTLFHYKKETRQHYSDYSGKNFSWMALLVSGFACAALLRFSNNLLWLSIPNSLFLQYIDLKFFSAASVFVFANVLLFQTLRQPEILQTPIKSKLLMLNKKSSLLTDSTIKEYVDVILKYMRSERPHLDSNLTLAQLSEGMDISMHHLSHVINSEFKKNFFDFINQYRIETAKDLLSDPTQKNKNITQIMYDSGFNSKSVFNTSFKTRTGCTPSQYRRNSLSAQSA